MKEGEYIILKNRNKLVAVILTIILAVIQSIDVEADSNELSSDQVDTLFEGMANIVLQLEEMGLDDGDIDELFGFTAREDSFYTETNIETVPYAGSFANEQSYNRKK